MTCFHDRPTWSVPEEARCEAVAKPDKQEWQRWKQHPRRCQRPANQCRDGHVVCYQHAESKEVAYVS